MRLIVKKYTDNGESIVETTDDGGRVIRELGGKWEAGKRISAYLEVTVDDTEIGADRLLEAISWLKDEVEKRKLVFAAKKARKTRKPGKTASQ